MHTNGTKREHAKQWRMGKARLLLIIPTSMLGKWSRMWWWHVKTDMKLYSKNQIHPGSSMFKNWQEEILIMSLDKRYNRWRNNTSTMLPSTVFFSPKNHVEMREGPMDQTQLMAWVPIPAPLQPSQTGGLVAHTSNMPFKWRGGFPGGF